MFAYDKLPSEVRGGMQRYIEGHVDPGHFLTAILSNDLHDTFAKASLINAQTIGAIVQWVYWEAPSKCWGDRMTVRKWIEAGR